MCARGPVLLRTLPPLGNCSILMVLRILEGCRSGRGGEALELLKEAAATPPQKTPQYPGPFWYSGLQQLPQTVVEGETLPLANQE